MFSKWRIIIIYCFESLIQYLSLFTISHQFKKCAADPFVIPKMFFATAQIFSSVDIIRTIASIKTKILFGRGSLISSMIS